MRSDFNSKLARVLGALILLVLMLAATSSGREPGSEPILTSREPPPGPLLGLYSQFGAIKREVVPIGSKPERWEESSIRGAGDLSDIAAIGPNDVWVVGQHAGLPAIGFIAHWDGQDWRSYSGLDGLSDAPTTIRISARTHDDVWVLGQSVISPEPHVLHWDGTDWKAVPSPVIADSSIHLQSIAAVGDNDVWAVGNVVDKSASAEALMVHWNGRNWMTYPFRVRGKYGGFDQVVAGSSSDIWALGHSQDGKLYARWDGNSWTNTPGPGSPWSSFSNAAMRGTSNIWAVGGSVVFGGYTHVSTYTMHWNGQAWSSVADSHINTYGGYEGLSALSSLDAKPGGDVWAAGVYNLDYVIMRWHENEWEIASCPGHRASDREAFSSQRAIAAVAPNEIWAVGSHGMLLRFSPGTCTE